MPAKHTSLKGQLLLDSGKLHGSFFHRTVLLICQHDEEGAFGLVLNRPTGKQVGEALEAELSAQVRAQDLYLGGPVQPQALSYLHSDAFLPESNVLPNLRLDHSLETLQALGEGYSATRQLRVFAGYAGWSAGQLDDEMKRDTWLTHPASLEWVFDVQAGELWRRVLAAKGPRYRLLAEQPEDLSWN
ncbi:MAG: hypothetical protein RJA22_2818 [Verrucomicrobiota bacterium]|jgi:putative transcriptional regulator